MMDDELKAIPLGLCAKDLLPEVRCESAVAVTVVNVHLDSKHFFMELNKDVL